MKEAVLKSHTSLVAQQTHINEWAEQIRECNNRPPGVTVKEWCQSQGLTKASYYWRLRKVREALLMAADFGPTFVELKKPVPEPSVTMISENTTPSQVVAILRKDSYSIEITDLASTSFLQNLLEACIMLKEGTGFKKVYLSPGFTDLRRGIDGLAGIIRFQFQLDPYDKNTLFLFCGRRTDRIKGLLWEGDGFLLLSE